MISNDITGMKSATAQYQAANSTSAKGTTQLSTNDFLNLITTQLTYQDPMDPVSNQEFVSQQAQLQQVSYLGDISKSVTSSSAVTQTLALVGKEVTMTDPDDSKKTITGKVSEACFDSTTATIKLEGKTTEYPVSNVLSVKNGTTTSTTTTK